MNPLDRSRKDGADRSGKYQGSYQVLDPSLLGRPVHLLPKFARRFADALGTAMSGPGGRRYWGAYRLANLAFERAPDDESLRWLALAGPLGTAAVAFERSLLLGLLEGRYGRKNKGPGAPRDPALERVTATEERLAATLTVQLAECLHARVAEGLAAVGVEVPGADAAVVEAPGPASAPGKAGWVIRITLSALGAEGEQQSQCWIGLDQELMAHVLQGLKEERNSVRTARAGNDSLSSGLFVKLEGRLVSKEVTLGALFEMKVGDVIPVSVGRADVLLDESRLFTAAVGEHKGKLCLTSFEDAE
ncbi:FliM/FliN family flagellar motor C-terminal domain-containing protein [Massilia sp. IC2-477]|uniref:FliM/FliN family flagellar motor switch protein n=1 Tax=unclassified Massilia TaxID=2609279 RepID=UPI001D0FAE35|nr:MULTISPECIES: FliM/FliN family flagellar motor C-terminal domain-containing protein [unclassified Massilia]MCC2954329.1 FliM/FliN family flagellar motor C-terminal domain-containing protein [Massilia sp. IC2-477]MCC2971768.1 FliM/FliN family flagellar motor C-terminal domain-containing protein [Massilia sp. IC2-476]